MNMKRIVFKIAKSFCACFITLLFFSCEITTICEWKKKGKGYHEKGQD